MVAPTDKPAQPAVIVLTGLGQTADLRRTGPDSWEWLENSATFKFRTVSASSSELLIHDPSRDMSSAQSPNRGDILEVRFDRKLDSTLPDCFLLDAPSAGTNLRRSDG